MCSYLGDKSAGADGIKHHSHANQTLHVVIFSPSQEILVSHVVGSLIDHEAAALHPAGLTPVQVVGHVRAVAHALVGATLEVPLLVEDDLKERSNVGWVKPLKMIKIALMLAE